MYVSITKPDLRVIHKHPEALAVRSLVDLELPHVPVSVVAVYPSCLGGFTDLELRMLYRNITGEALTSILRENLVGQTVGALLSLSDTPCNGYEAMLQAKHARKGDARQVYRYAPGAYTPHVYDGLDMPEPVHYRAGYQPTNIEAVTATESSKSQLEISKPVKVARSEVVEPQQGCPSWHPLHKK